MSGLATVLAGRRPAGVHRWQGRPDDAADAARTAGWTPAEVDGARLGGVDDLLGLLAAELVFAPHFGRNLDALHDCLAERTAPAVVVARDWLAPLDADPRRGAALLAVLAEREPGEPALEVLLVGAVPAWADLPLLD